MNRGLIIAVAVMASLLEIIDVSIVNVALPTMMGNLGATLEDISMIITGYAIANAIVLPVSGWLSERIGRRRYYLSCILLFTASSVACGLAPNLYFLIVFRIIQGLMGGALLPTSQALIYEQFPKEKAGIAGAIFGMSVMIGPALGPVMGGYLTDEFGWRSIFNINLPLGILAFAVGFSVITERPRTEAELEAGPQVPQEFDGLGLALLVLGVGCLQYVLERGESEDWFSSRSILINTIISMTCLPAFVWWETKVKNPIINVRLFLQGIVFNGIALMACLGFFLYGAVFLLPVFVARSYHYTATQTGLLFIPGSLVTMFMMPFIGRMMAAGQNPKVLIFIGLVSLEVCMWIMTGFSPVTDKSEILLSLYVRGFALAFMFVPINSSILSQFKGATLGQVSGLLNLFRQLGGSAGIALVATLLSANSKQNYVDLSARVSALSPAAQLAYGQAHSAMNGKMLSQVGMLSIADPAIRLIQGRVLNQAFMLSFIQLIWTMMIIFSIAFVPWYFLELREKPSGPVDAH